MANQISRLVGNIEAIKTLIEKFPMSILENAQGKTYTSTIDFVIDVLRMLGISEQDILDELILLIFNVPNAVEIYNGIGNFTYKKIRKPTDEQIRQAIISEYKSTADIDDPMYIAVETGTDASGNTTYDYYSKKAPLISDDTNSDFLAGLEESIKTIIADILVGIMSCSINPRIPEEALDTHKGETISGVPLPIDFIDTFNLLSLCPTNEIGKNFYNVEDDLSSTELYKSFDLNAFIWYIVNRSSKKPQTEDNKNMWDSRVYSNNLGYSVRQKAEDWNKWYTSKTKEGTPANGTIFYTEDEGGSQAEYLKAWESGYTSNMPLFPILQLENYTNYTGTKQFYAYFPAQTYTFKDENGNVKRSTIYKFNDDYLHSIRILSPRVIIANMLEDLLNGTMTASLSINLNPKMQMIEAKLNKYIKTAMEVDDTTVSDCYYSFSNEDYEEMVRNNELKRYSAVSVGGDTASATQVDPSYELDAINSISSQASSNEKVSTITKTVYDISAIPAESEGTTDGVESNTEWLKKVVMALVRPIIRAVMSPQVMMLFAIDFQLLGIINLRVDPESFAATFEDLLFKKFMSVFVSLIQLLKDKIVEFLMELFYKNIEPLIITFYAMILLEQLNDWIDLLEEAIKCLPNFDFSKNRVLGQIDDVNYADITPTQDTPESSDPCNNS